MSRPNPASPGLVFIGAVDHAPSAQMLGGWVNIQGEAVQGRITVTAYLGEERLGSTLNDLYRPDLGAELGFHLKLARLPTAEDWTANSLRVVAQYGAAESQLSIFEAVLEGVRLEALTEGIRSASDEGLFQLLERAADPGRPGLRARLALALPGLARSDMSASVEENLPSQVSIAQGARDWGGTCVVGAEGFLYVWEGLNNLFSAYSATEEEVGPVALDWMSLIKARAERMTGARFLQLIIPEKSTVMPQQFPYELPCALTPLMERLEALLGTGDAAEVYLNAGATLRGVMAPHHPFRRADSHLSPEGCRVLTNAILDRLGANFQFAPFVGAEIVQWGELSDKFPPLRLLDVVREPEPEAYSQWSGDLATEVSKPDGGRHIGITLSSRNRCAPVDASVLVFGNSFFDVGFKSGTLSWWAQRCFRDFNFVWSPSLDAEAVDRLQPDVVICQTNERFLRRVAQS